MARLSSLLLSILLGCSSAPPPREPERVFADTLRKYAEDGDALAALTGLDELLKATPDWAEAHLARATILLGSGRPAGALAGFDRALAIRPKFLDALGARGLLLAEQGRMAEAERDFKTLIDAAPKAPDGYLFRAWLELREGRYSESQRDLAEARALGPGRWQDYHNAGAVAARAGRWAQAERNFEFSVLLRPDHSDGWFALSRAHAAQGRPDQALEDLERADREKPRDPAVWYARAELLRSLQRYVEAIKSYDRAIELGAAPIMHSGRAQACACIGDARGAEAGFAIALELEPNLREAWVARARWRSANGRLEEAREDYAAALRIRASAPVLRELARLYQDNGQWNLAITGYEHALRICVEPELRPVLERDLAEAKARKK